MKIQKIKQPEQNNLVIIAGKETAFSEYGFSAPELEFISKNINDEKAEFELNQYSRMVYLWIFDMDTKSNNGNRKETARKSANSILKKLNGEKSTVVDILAPSVDKGIVKSFLVGLLLSTYRFNGYKKKDAAEKQKNHLEEINIAVETITEDDITEVLNVTEAVFFTRNLVNEPSTVINPVRMAELLKKEAENAGCTVEIFDKKKIEELQFNGILAVNKGSVDEPSFTVIEWKPQNPVNEKPYILVGKGVTFDTGGINLKPGSEHLVPMKADMAGAATVAGTILAIARQKLNIHVKAFVPATDNRPGLNAYVPSDIVTMKNGVNVEIINTDAEGRMILADGLCYAQEFDPELVIDVATLTGAAVHAVGSHASVVVCNKVEKQIMQQLDEAGHFTYERVVEMPMWDEYDEMIKSTFADIKNVGGKEAGAITAGKFLQNFTDYPWIHIDIAGPAFTEKDDNYRGYGGTGAGVRLLYNFFKTIAK